MYNSPAVVVNKSGFLSALVKGVFGTIIALIVCATALGLYGIRLIDRQVETVVEGGIEGLPELLHALPTWQNARLSLPPVLADALDDREALDYRSQLTIRARLERSHKPDGRGAAILEVTNTGQSAVSWLTVRAVAEDESDVQVCELPMRVASPIQGGKDWRGPILPGETRTIVQALDNIEGEARIKVELTGLRVRNAPQQEPETPAVKPA